MSQESPVTMTRFHLTEGASISSLDEDRPTILRRLMSIENKVDRLLERE